MEIGLHHFERVKGSKRRFFPARCIHFVQNLRSFGVARGSKTRYYFAKMITESGLADGKSRQAAILLEEGFSPMQVSSHLRLRLDRVCAMADDIKPKKVIGDVESYADWRKRERDEIEIKILTFVGKQLDALDKLPQPFSRAEARRFFKLADLLYKIVHRPAFRRRKTATVHTSFNKG